MRTEVQRRIGLALVLVVIGAAILVIERPWDPGSSVPPPPDNLPADLAGLAGAPDFAGATGWLNTPGEEPVDLVSLRGKVVLVDFWTYSCINCIRTFPYLRAWNEAYADDGLVIVGVHTPEFLFEREKDNVRDAAERHNLTWAIGLDNDYDVWQAYHNRYWPAKYVVDQYGKIRYTRFGEGAYEETEAKIRELLSEAGHAPNNDPVTIDPDASASGSGRTPELYAGSEQGTSGSAIGNPEGYHPGQTISYARPGSVERDKIYLVGTWFNDDDYVRAEGENASVVVSFKAGGANFVGNGPEAARVPVLLDGESVPVDRAGSDIAYQDGGSFIELDGPRSYVFYGGPFEEHTVELDVPVGFSLFTFAFSSFETT